MIVLRVVSRSNIAEVIAHLHLENLEGDQLTLEDLQVQSTYSPISIDYVLIPARNARLESLHVGYDV